MCVCVIFKALPQQSASDSESDSDSDSDSVNSPLRLLLGRLPRTYILLGLAADLYRLPRTYILFGLSVYYNNNNK